MAALVWVRRAGHTTSTTPELIRQGKKKDENGENRYVSYMWECKSKVSEMVV